MKIYVILKFFKKKPKLLYVCDRTFIAFNILFSAPFFSKHTNFFIIGSYVYACAWASFPMLGWGEYGVEAYGTSCTLKWTENRGFVTLMLISCIIFPVIIMKFCYGGVYLYLRRHCKAFRTDRSKMGINVRKREGYLIKVRSHSEIVVWFNLKNAKRQYKLLILFLYLHQISV